MIDFKSFYGVVKKISDFYTGNENDLGCYKLVEVHDDDGNIVNFVVGPNTYFVEQTMIVVGDMVVGFYDGNAPVPFIFPPQYRALVMAKVIPGQIAHVDYFNEQYVSRDGTLKINMSPYIPIIMENGQTYSGKLSNRPLVVLYGAKTKSIPAQTIPYRIIVLCRL